MSNGKKKREVGIWRQGIKGLRASEFQRKWSRNTFADGNVNVVD